MLRWTVRTIWVAVDLPAVVAFAHMDGKNVDPAALMLAALAAAANPLVNSGRWGPISTIVFPFLGAIPFAYAWQAKGKLDLPESLAVWAAMTLVAGTIIAWPLQTVVDRFHDPTNGGSVWSDNSFLASVLALIVGASAVGLFPAKRLRRRTPV